MRILLAVAVVAGLSATSLAGEPNYPIAVAGMFLADKYCGLSVPPEAVRVTYLASGMSQAELSSRAAVAARIILNGFKNDPDAAVEFCADMARALGSLK